MRDPEVVYRSLMKRLGAPSDPGPDVLVQPVKHWKPFVPVTAAAYKPAHGGYPGAVKR